MTLLFLIILSSFLRFFRLPQFTEFYGDQGMDGLLVLDAIEKHVIPLVGPLASQGLHQGATYLYLLTPGLVLARFDPLGPAFFMATLGVIHVLLFYLLARKLFGKLPAFLTSFLFALSPIAIYQSRTYWNSFLLPISVTLLLLCFAKLKEEKKLRWFVLTGFVLGFTVQFHYTGLFLLILVFLLGVSLSLWRYKLQTSFAFLAFLLPLLPFFIYQMQHDFVDVKGLLLYMLPFEEVYRNIVPPAIPTLLGLVFQNLAPALPVVTNILIGGATIVIPFALRIAHFWHKFLAFWILLALILVTRNKGDFQVHYMDFLFPIPFLLFASFLNALEVKKVTPTVLIVVAAFFLLINILSLDMFKSSNDRLARTRSMVETMIQEAGNNPFSFTIISPSFSDSHYRYLFKIYGVEPTRITQGDYNRLFIACEKLDCPTGESLAKETRFPVTCFDLHCEIEYPKIDLTEWNLIEEQGIRGGTLFRFERASAQNKQ